MFSLINVILRKKKKVCAFRQLFFVCKCVDFRVLNTYMKVLVLFMHISLLLPAPYNSAHNCCSYLLGMSMRSGSRESYSSWWALPMLHISFCISPVLSELDVLYYHGWGSTWASLEAQKEPVIFKKGHKNSTSDLNSGPEIDS